MTTPGSSELDAMPESDGPEREPLVDALSQAAFATMSVLTRVAAENDLSLTQLRVLAILRGRRMRVSALAKYLGLEKSTLSGLVDRAAKRGLVSRAPAADDGRAVEVLLADAGAALGDHVGRRVAAELSALTGSLPADERDTLRGLLEKMLTGTRVRPRAEGVVARALEATARPAE